MAVPKPAIYTITPHKFTIYDSELSDADCDSDSEEWVSISTSTTAGTLPNHITLRPRGHDLPLKPTRKQSNLERQIRIPKPAPLSLLKSHIPTLKAIYIVNPTSLHSTSRNWRNASLSGPFCSWRCVGSAPVGMHIPSASECYLRVCADCVRGRIVLVCDGTWRADGPGVCERHAGVVEGREGMSGGVVGESERARDVDLFEAVVGAVQPFRRAETEREGVRVFDMSEAGRAERDVVHRDGCECVQK